MRQSDGTEREVGSPMRNLGVFAVIFSVALGMRLLLIFSLKPYEVTGPLAESGAIRSWSELDSSSVRIAEMEGAGIRYAVEGDLQHSFRIKSGPSAHIAPSTGGSWPASTSSWA